MKEFLQLMRRFVSPYKKYIGWAVLLNILSAVFNVFSFTFLIPILSILFKTEGADKVYHFMEWGSGDLADVAKNNFYYYISQMIIDNGPTMALIFLGLFLMIMTLFKTGCYPYYGVCQGDASADVILLGREKRRYYRSYERGRG